MPPAQRRQPLKTLPPRVAPLGQRLASMVPGSWRTSDMTAAERGYDHAWRKRRALHLREHPLCCYCQRQGYVTPATVADHITPHRGNAALFDGPLQSVCAPCHSSVKAREESGLPALGIDVDVPILDAAHDPRAP